MENSTDVSDNYDFYKHFETYVFGIYLAVATIALSLHNRSQRQVAHIFQFNLLLSMIQTLVSFLLQGFKNNIKELLGICLIPYELITASRLSVVIAVLALQGDVFWALEQPLVYNQDITEERALVFCIGSKVVSLVITMLVGFTTDALNSGQTIIQYRKHFAIILMVEIPTVLSFFVVGFMTYHLGKIRRKIVKTDLTNQSQNVETRVEPMNEVPVQAAEVLMDVKRLDNESNDMFYRVPRVAWSKSGPPDQEQQDSQVQVSGFFGNIDIGEKLKVIHSGLRVNLYLILWVLILMPNAILISVYSKDRNTLNSYPLRIFRFLSCSSLPTLVLYRVKFHNGL